MSDEHSETTARYRRMLATLERLLSLDAVELDESMQEAADYIADVLATDKVDVFLYRAERDELQAVGTSDTPMGRLQRELGLDCLPLAGGGRAVQVFTSGEAYLACRAEEDATELNGIVQDLGVRSAIMAPLRIGVERRGVVLASSARPEHFDPEDLLFLKAIARWIGLVAERAIHVEALTRHAADSAYRASALELLDTLTPRQRQIAALIAQGHSNAEIARQLVLVPGTVANHVEQILTRLGFRNRTQVAAWAAASGLLGTDGSADRSTT